MKTHKFFNDATRKAMFERVKGYVDKSEDPEARIRRIRREHGIEKVYRFDLGENAEGYSPRIRDYLATLRDDSRIRERLSDWLNVYPDRHHGDLKARLAAKYRLPAEWFVIGAGLDSLLDLITRVLLEPRDTYLTPVPSFYLFEEYSERMGAIPFFLELREEDDFRWTAQTTQQFRRLVDTFRPKLIWIANPNNPTGQLIHESLLEDLIEYATGFNCFVVIDEAYGEYADPPGGVHSAAQFLHRYDNLIVLRTFSKKYGLASLRIGYLMSASADLREGLQVHSPHFPITQISADLARIVLEDDSYLDHTRTRLATQRREVFERLSRLSSFRLVPSQTNIFMLRNRRLDGRAFIDALERRGILAAAQPISGIRDHGYARFTLRSREDNRVLCAACEDIDRELAQD